MIFIFSLWLLAHAPIELRVDPHFCLAPCDVRVIVRVDPHPDNRWWILQIDGPMIQGSMHQMEGEATPATQEAVWYRSLPEGDYQVTAVVYRVNQQSSEAGRATTAVKVGGDALRRKR